jgi:DNA polymerase-1
MGIRERAVRSFGLYANLNGQCNEHEWAIESKRIYYLRTGNNIGHSIQNGATSLRVGNPNHEPSGDHRISNYPSMYNLRERVPSYSVVNRHANTELAKCSLTDQFAHGLSTPMSAVNDDNGLLSMPSSSKVESSLHDYSSMEVSPPNISNTEHKLVAKKVVPSFPDGTILTSESKSKRKALAGIYDKVLVVDNIDSAKNVVRLLTTKYKSFVHACDTEVFSKTLLELFTSL